LLGAILDDSDFDPQPATKLYDTYLAPFMRKYADPPSNRGLHPHTKLQRMLGKRNCHGMWKEQQNVYDEDLRVVNVIVTGEWVSLQADGQSRSTTRSSASERPKPGRLLRGAPLRPRARVSWR
jgi:hypothetical protein